LEDSGLVSYTMAPYLDDMSSPAPAEKLRPAPGPAAGGDELDDLFDYDAGLDDVFRDLEPRKPVSPKDSSRKRRADLGLGIDKEVEVVKKARVPRVKLDEDRYQLENERFYRPS
jgi:replication fork protection complex subunit Csm3/Swi3